ncbi:hypothetical protein D9756_000841 [Leucocoprinus leucothites]|uniref:Mitochondrial ribosomal protein S11 n=1 Tax=Leucocoprinus leucothites TaxID=201217 RepID=A0A8H5LNR5_9AGAR|nr:hypothetical protein D9756_000841 [Leucoagaricus leucothites]
MLSRRVLGLRHVSTTAQQEFINELKSVAQVNPLTGLQTTASDDNPPIPAGPEAYASPRDNPMSTAKNEKWIQKMQLPPRATHRFDCFASRNNTIATLSSLAYSEKEPFKPPVSNVIAWFSGGSVGFKKAQRASFEAGHQCAVRVFQLIEEAKKQGTVRVELYLKGFGMGRDAVKTALMAAEGDGIRDVVKQVTDRTPIKIGGTRAKKTRRL